MADFGFVRVEQRGGCAWVTLDRPPLNLIVPEMIRGIKAAFEELREDPRVRAAVLTGSGRAMTAGMQLQFLRALTARVAKACIASVQHAIPISPLAPRPMSH